MNNSFWNALVVKVSHFIHEDKVLQEHWTPSTNSQHCRLVANWSSCSRCQMIRAMCLNVAHNKNTQLSNICGHFWKNQCTLFQHKAFIYIRLCPGYRNATSGNRLKVQPSTWRHPWNRKCIAHRSTWSSGSRDMLVDKQTDKLITILRSPTRT